MKFKIDENLPVEVKDRLVAHGHDAHTVHTASQRGNASSQTEVPDETDAEPDPGNPAGHPRNQRG